VPQGTEAITTNAQLQDVKSAFVEKGIVLEQNSESEFKTEPMNLTPFAVIYYQAMKNGDGTKIVAIDKREYKSFRVGVDDVLSDQHHEKIWGLVADIMDRNNLAYEFK
jgi:hypothetical protein